VGRLVSSDPFTTTLPATNAHTLPHTRTRKKHTFKPSTTPTTHRYRKLPIKKLIIIRTARIPIIKLETSSRVVADISLGDGSGPRAANYISQQVRCVLLLSGGAMRVVVSVSDVSVCAH
jgi:hypothetical protein